MNRAYGSRGFRRSVFAFTALSIAASIPLTGAQADPTARDEAGAETTASIRAADSAYSARPGAPRPVGHGEAWRQHVKEGIELDMRGLHDEADAVWDGLEASDPGDPEPWLRRVDTVYWRHWYDEGEGLDENEIRSPLDQSKALAQRRLKQDKEDLRARWLLGEVLMQEARFEGQRGNYMKAGTMGEKGRKQLESLLEDQPDNLEARYTLGLYYYFASLMPDAVQSMSWLWFIPKGDRDVGLALIEQARTSSSVYEPPASMLLMAIHTYHSPTDIPAALDIASDLHARYPENAILHFELLEVLLKARRHDELLAKALELEQRRDEAEGIAGRATLAKLWRARAAIDRGDAASARAIAFGIDADDPKLPEWGAPWLWVVRGQVLDLEGDRDAAVLAYETVISLESEGFNSRRPQRMAKAGIESAYVAGSDIDGPFIGSSE